MLLTFTAFTQPAPDPVIAYTRVSFGLGSQFIYHLPAKPRLLVWLWFLSLRSHHDMLIAALLFRALLMTSQSLFVGAAPARLMASAISPSQEHTFNTNYRSTAEIVWSCIVTVFACTWLSVHPNVSSANSSWTLRMKDRISLMVWGIAAPEFLVIFAYRQWRGSKDITRTIRKVIKEDKLGSTSYLF